jgi:hypothetical protein
MKEGYALNLMKVEGGAVKAVSELILSLSLVLTLATCVLGQGAGHKPSQVTHKLKGISFQSSDQYKPKVVKGVPAGTMVLVHEDGGDAVFVTVFSEKTPANKLVEELSASLLAGWLPGEPQKFQWKEPRGGYVQKAGRFDVSRGKVMGFNGESRVMLEYHHINYQGKDVLVGYYYTMDKGAQAKAAFNSGMGGGNGRAGSECATIISSITKEKKDDTSVGQPPPPGA